MVKKKVTLTVEEHVVEQAKELGINMSSFLDIRLREFIALTQQSKVASHSVDNPLPAVSNKNKSMDRTGFSHAVVAAGGAEATPAFLNPWPLACEASDLPLIYRPIADGNSGRPILTLSLPRQRY